MTQRLEFFHSYINKIGKTESPLPRCPADSASHTIYVCDWWQANSIKPGLELWRFDLESLASWDGHLEQGSTSLQCYF